MLFIPMSFAKTLTWNKAGKIQKIEVIKMNNIHFNKECQKLAEKCHAFKALRMDLKTKHLSKLAGHPASKMCKTYGGQSIILKDEEKNEYDYCLFSDASMIDSWDLKNFKER